MHGFSAMLHGGLGVRHVCRAAGNAQTEHGNQNTAARCSGQFWGRGAGIVAVAAGLDVGRSAK